MLGDGSNVCCYVGGIRDRCSHDAAGHDVLESTAHSLGDAPYPTATLVADVIQKANQSSSGGHSGGGTVIMQPIATQSRSWALRSVDRGIYVISPA